MTVNKIINHAQIQQFHIQSPQGSITIAGQNRIVSTQNSACNWLITLFQRFIEAIKNLFSCCQKKPPLIAQNQPIQPRVEPIVVRQDPEQVRQHEERERQPIQVPAEPLRELEIEQIEEELRLLVDNPQNHRMGIIRSNITDALARQIQRLQRAIIAHPVNPVQAEQIALKRRGLLYGQAIGDGLGLLTEFEDAAHARAMINGRPIEYALFNDPAFLAGGQGLRADHRRNFTMLRHAGWTDDTDQMICLLRAYLRWWHEDNLDPAQAFAEELSNWHHGGPQGRGGLQGRENPELRGLGALVGAVLQRPEFADNPARAAFEVWRQNPDPVRRPAANGAVMRTAGLAAISYDSIQNLVNNTITFAEVTHADPRCLASCVAVNIALALMINGVRNQDTIRHYSQEIAIAVLFKQMFMVYFNDARLPIAEFTRYFTQFKDELNQHLNALNYDQLRLSGNQMIGYTYKCMGAGFVALRVAQNHIDQGVPVEQAVRRSLEELIAQGGDADTNGAVAGAMLGAAYGYQSLPESWRENMNAQDRVVLEQTEQQIAEIRIGAQ